jgi:hypothetical protein
MIYLCGMKNDTLQTPPWVYTELGHIDLDPCAGVQLIADVNYRKNGLEFPWKGFVFCNPPFSQKELWIEKMIKHGNGILLLPERGSAPWFGPLAQACTAYFVMGKKINFIGGSSSNNVGTVLFLFGEEAVSRIRKSSLPGHLCRVEYFRSR